jgi:hypothetical protein
MRFFQDKNKFIKIITFCFIFYFVIKVSLVLVENSILSIVKSPKFHDFLIEQLEYHINRYAEQLESNPNRQVIVQDSLKKILEKYSPILHDLKK